MDSLLTKVLRHPKIRSATIVGNECPCKGNLSARPHSYKKNIKKVCLTPSQHHQICRRCSASAAPPLRHNHTSQLSLPTTSTHHVSSRVPSRFHIIVVGCITSSSSSSVSRRRRRRRRRRRCNNVVTTTLYRRPIYTNLYTTQLPRSTLVILKVKYQRYVRSVPRTMNIGENECVAVWQCGSVAVCWWVAVGGLRCGTPTAATDSEAARVTETVRTHSLTHSHSLN